VAGELDRFAKATALKKWKLGDTIRNLPVIDGFAAPTKIEQYTLTEYPIDYSFKYVTRYDRCTTCHLGLEKATFTKADLKTLSSSELQSDEGKKVAQLYEMYETRQKEGEQLAFDLDDLPVKRSWPVGWICGSLLIVALAAGGGLAYKSSPRLGTLVVLGGFVVALGASTVLARMSPRVPDVPSVQLTPGQINEFCVHPRLDLFVDPNSPHPAEKFGCTSCHSGQGSATDFRNAMHTPNSLKEREEWTKEHSWSSIHFWDYPMLPKRFVESGCLKCHHQVTDLIRHGNREEAPKLLRGYNLVRENGCFGCHEISGLKSGKEIGPDLRLEPSPPLSAYTALERVKMLSDPLNPPGLMRKVGPSLYRISEKTNQSWARKWIQAPRDFRASTRMPHFYGLSNDAKEALPPEQKEFPNAEIHSIAYYLFTESADYLKGEDRYRKAMENRIAELKQKQSVNLISDSETKLLEELTRRLQLDQKPIPLVKEIRDGSGKVVQLPAAPADKKDQDAQVLLGRQLFSERGCLACHIHNGVAKSQGDVAAINSEANFGPDLSRLAAKIAPENGDADAKRRWLVQWIMNPTVYFPRTRMPITHLSVEQAAAVAAWLLSQSAADWQPSELEQPKSKDLADLARVFMLKAPGMTRQDVDDILKGPENAREGLKDLTGLALDADERALQGPLDDNKLKWYIGRKAITRLGCYGCHDTPGFATSKPIGTPLNDWGKKDPERLAFEDIVAYVENHYRTGEHGEHAEGQKPTYDEFFFGALEHHQREGFLHQKLEEPRSYDYNRIRAWDDRLRMPQFRFARGQSKGPDGETPEQKEERERKEEAEAREAVMTFILGLVAEPVPAAYLSQPEGDRQAEVKGRKVLDKFNCAGCHEVRPGVYEFNKNKDVTDELENNFKGSQKTFAADYLFPDDNAWVGQPSPRPDRHIAFGVPVPGADDPDKLILRLTEALRFTDSDKAVQNIRAGSSLGVPRKELLSETTPYGGAFVNWMLPYLAKRNPEVYKDYKNARAALPPPLLREGEKVQPGWLYQFLLDPQPIRYMPERDTEARGKLDLDTLARGTVLRMPRFSLAEDEAMALVNYFAAVDRRNNPAGGLNYPYYYVPQREEAYWHAATRKYVSGLSKELVTSRLKALEPTWEVLLREKVGEAERGLQAAEAAVKNAKPEDLKAAESSRTEAKAALDKLKAQLDKKDFAELNQQWLEKDAYAADAYRLLTSYNTPCLSCHQIGNLRLKPQGPPLDLAWERLRHDWTLHWIASPDRMLSYPTPMPQNFAANIVDAAGRSGQYPEFIGTPLEQVQAVRDILMIFPKAADMPVNRYNRAAAGGTGR
jgi:mono/diheme cytochrome c family protein